MRIVTTTKIKTRKIKTSNLTQSNILYSFCVNLRGVFNFKKYH